MSTVIIVVLLVVAVCYAVKSSAKHFAGQGGCCGGADAPKKVKKKINGVIVKMIDVEVAGMHCENCKIRIENAINSIDGLTGHVSLKNGIVTVKGTREFSDDEVLTAIRKAGYQTNAVFANR